MALAAFLLRGLSLLLRWLRPSRPLHRVEAQALLVLVVPIQKEEEDRPHRRIFSSEDQSLQEAF